MPLFASFHRPTSRANKQYGTTLQVFTLFFSMLTVCTLAQAEPASAPIAAPNSNPPLMQAVQTEVKTDSKTKNTANTDKLEISKQKIRLQQLEQANQLALAQNQELKLQNDNLNVQLKVLQSERSSQMFIYGAVVMLIGLMVGMLVMYMFNAQKRRRPF